jgi:hypothetical protein
MQEENGYQYRQRNVEYVQEENEAEEEVLDGVASVMAVALRRWGDAAMPFVEPLMPAVGQVRPASDAPAVASDDVRLASRRSPASLAGKARHTCLAGTCRCCSEALGLRESRSFRAAINASKYTCFKLRTSMTSKLESPAPVALQLLGGGGRTAGERRIGVIVMDDILEHAPAGAAKYMAQILPVLLQAAQDKARSKP